MAFLSTPGVRKKSLLTLMAATAAFAIALVVPLSANAEGEPDPNAEIKIVATEEATAPEEETTPIEEEEEEEEETPITDGSDEDSEEKIVPEDSTEETPAVETFTLVNTQNVVDNTNTEEYWENYTSINDQCFKHEGVDMQDNDHGYLSDNDIYVVLKNFVQAWFGDHFSLLVVNSGSVDNGYGPGNAIYTNPQSGLVDTYKGPLNSGGQQGTVSHWIVCKGETPPPPPPPVVEQCEVFNPPTTLTNLDSMFFEDRLNPDDPTNKGTHELVDGGIEIAATGGGYYSKSAGYIPVNIPFEEIGSPSLGYTVYSGASAGLNLVLYKNGVWFGTLVYEPLFAEWWINKVVPGMSAGPNPGYQLAYGTPDEFLQAFVAAGWDVDVKAIGYSLGSGAVGAGLVTSLVIGCDTYLFDKAVVAPTASAQIVCTEGDPTLQVTGTAGSEETEFKTQIFGVTVDTAVVAPGGNYSYTDPISEFQEGDSFTVTVLGNDETIFGPQEFTIDCTDVPPITPSVCTSADTLPTSTNLNPRGWVLGGAAEYVDGGIKFSSDNWVDAYVTHATNFELKDARNMFMDLDVADTSGNYGFAVIIETSLGNIHSEDYYSDELWTNSPGLLPVTGGGQGGPYSGSLEDALAIGNPTVTSVTFLFTSASPNSAILSEGGYNCLIQPFDFEKEPTPPTNPPVTPPSTTGLPNTGSGNPLPFVGAGVLLLLAGLAFVLVQQRRRTKASTSAE